MEKLIRQIEIPPASDPRSREVLRRHWLVTNGLGGYASGTIGGSPAWRYHGLLIAALPPPFGRTVMLNHIATSLSAPGAGWQDFGDLEPHVESGPSHWSLLQFRLENLVPVWTYDVGGAIIEKSILMVHDQNTVHISYRLRGEVRPVKIRARPFLQFRGHEQPVSEPIGPGYQISISGSRYEIAHGNFPPLRMTLSEEETSFANDGRFFRELIYEKESERGFESRGTLFTPGYFQFELAPGKSITLIASAEEWERLAALSPDEAAALYHKRCARLLSDAPETARARPAGDLVLSADQFIFTPRERIADTARARAVGDEVRTVIAGYPWFTDWGRDTMISLEGLTLSTGRFAEAGWILRTFARHIQDGLIPNMFPEGNHRGLYHTADATLWYFHALDRYLEFSKDRDTLKALLPGLVEIVDRHIHGTRFGIHVDPADGLLCQGQEGYQLTWMDAKVEDWVVTPRRGKAVEINALWYNALRLMENWLREDGDAHAAEQLSQRSKQAYESFNRRFWFPAEHHLYDVIDGPSGDDPALRPNQVIAISLKFPVLDPQYWKPVLAVTREKLLTPVGLRSLSPNHRDYKAKYFGDLRSRDAAYHQGTVWAWLMGPFVDAWLKAYPDDKQNAIDFLKGFEPHLNEGCVGSINEIFDAEHPFTPRGCVAQAWSVAEVLRLYLKLHPPAA